MKTASRAKIDGKMFAGISDPSVQTFGRRRDFGKTAGAAAKTAAR